MAFGQKQLAVAVPQPGTSNTPLPLRVRTGGGFLGLFPTFTTLPPFRPVVFSVNETNAAAVAALTAEISALFASINGQVGQANLPGTILSSLSEINANLTRIADQKAAVASSLNNLVIAVGSYTAAVNQQTQILGTKAANAVQFNNFYKAYSNEDPIMPGLKEQLEQSVKDGLELHSQSNRTGFVNTTIKNIVTSTGTWISSTEAYQTISSYLSKIKDNIAATLAASSKSISSILSTGKTPK